MSALLTRFFMKHGYRYFLTACVSIGTASLIHDALGFNLPFYVFIPAEIFIMTFLYLLKRYKANAVLYFTLEGLVLILLLVNHFTQSSFFTFIDALLHWWLQGFPMNDVTFPYPLFTTMLFLTLSSILTFFLQKYFTIRIVLATSIASTLTYLGFRESVLSFLPVFFLLFYCFFVFYETIFHVFHSNRLRDMDANPSSFAVTTFLIPILVLPVLASCALPHSDQPMQWTYVKNTYYGIRDFVESIPGKLGEMFHAASQEFTLSMTGYTESANLRNGGITDSDAVSLSLFTRSVPKGSLYLNGSIMDTYTGHSWERETDSDDPIPDYLLDAYELLYTLARFEPAVSADDSPTGSEPFPMLERKAITITFEDLSTKTVLYPSKTVRVNMRSQSLSYERQGDNLLFNKVKKKDTSYGVTYYNPDYSNERLTSLLQKQTHTEDPAHRSESEETVLSEEEAKTFLSSHFPELMEQLPKTGLDDLLDERKERIYRNYTHLPDELPERVSNLAKELTKGCDNDYDRLKALEAYLNTLNYTKTPPVSPEGRDVVDYFLFEGNKGYCTYFASGMAVMARCIGLPSRYVQGYTTSFKNRYSSFTYLVASNRAHAWVEVYLEGFGWVPFEPTAGYEEVRYMEWELMDTPSPAKKKAEANIHLTPSYQEDEEETEAKRNASNQSNATLIILVISLTGLLILCILPLYPILCRLRYERRYSDLDENGRITMEIHRILSLLHTLGLHISEGESLTKYSDRVAKLYPDMRQVSKSYIPIRYGNSQVKEEDVSFTKEFRISLEQSLKERIGRLRFQIHTVRFYLSRIPALPTPK